MATQIHGFGPNGELSPGAEAALDGLGGGGGGSGVTATDAPTKPTEGASASYFVTDAVVWPEGLVWSTDPDGNSPPYIEAYALVSMFTLDGVTRAVMGATFPSEATTTTTTTAGTTTTTTTSATTTTTTTEATTTTTTTGGAVGPYVWEREVASSSEGASSSTSVPLTVAGTSGRLLVAALSVDKNAGAISVSAGWTIGAEYIGNSVSGALAYRLATGSDDIAWTLGTAQIAVTTVHEWSGFAGAPTLQDSAFAPNPVDDATRSSLTVDAGAASAQALAVVSAGQDTSPGPGQVIDTTVSGGYVFRKKMRASTGGVSLFFAEQEVDASDATAATFDFNIANDQAYALTILLRG